MEVQLMRKLVICAATCFGLSAGTGRCQDAAPPPSPKEITQALQEHKDAVAALRTSERALEASAKKLEALLKRVPQPTGVIAEAPAALPAVSYSFPISGQPTILPVPASPDAPAARDTTQEALKVILDRLERMEKRLVEIEKK
jgi:hypothetical protein